MGPVKTLLSDTGPLLDLTIHRLSQLDRQQGRQAFDRLKGAGALKALTSLPELERFVSTVRGQFGEVWYSTGSLVELDRHARKALEATNWRASAESRLMDAFWLSFDSLQDLLELRLVPQPLQGDLQPLELSRRGPVDEHLRLLMLKHDKLWMATIDRQLRAACSELTSGRVINL